MASGTEHPELQKLQADTCKASTPVQKARGVSGGRDIVLISWNQVHGEARDAGVNGEDGLTPGQTQQVLRLGAKVMLLHSLDHFFSALFVSGHTLPVLLAPVRAHVPVRWALVYLKAAPRESRVHKTHSRL